MSKDQDTSTGALEMVDHQWLSALVEKQGVWETKGKEGNEQRILVGMKNNRPAKKARLALLTDNITKEGWHNTGQGFIFDTKNNLIDGQHRAIVLYNYSIQYPNKKFPVWVIRGIKPSAFDYIDCGVPRSAADTLYRSGLDTEQHKELANAARFLHLVMSGQSLRAGGKISNAYIHSMLKGEHKGLRDAMADVLAETVEVETGVTDLIVPLKKMAGLAYWGLFVYLASDKYKGTSLASDVMRFMTLVALGYDDDGEYLPRAHPISRLRDKLLGDSKPRGAEDKFRLIVHAFNLHQVGSPEVRNLSWTTTPTLSGEAPPATPSPSQEEDAEPQEEKVPKIRRTRSKRTVAAE